VAEQALHIGIQHAVVGNETKDVSQAIQSYAEGQGYGVVREYTGHGVGRNMHEDPQVPNWWPVGLNRKQRQKWQSVPLRPGMTFALEPMLTMGALKTRVLADHWTVVMDDGAMCVHTEHTIAITDGEPLILTLL
jgi:methionyl aminopeptidase